MMRIVMEGARLTLWPSFSLAIFMISTLVMLVWIFRPGSRTFYQTMSSIALDDAEPKNAPKTDWKD
jgi:cbb3-type cytochrome oxidase subunit 3